MTKPWSTCGQEAKGERRLVKERVSCVLEDHDNVEERSLESTHRLKSGFQFLLLRSGVEISTFKAVGERASFSAENLYGPLHAAKSRVQNLRRIWRN